LKQQSVYGGLAPLESNLINATGVIKVKLLRSF